MRPRSEGRSRVFRFAITSKDDICEENAYHLFCFKTKSDKDYHQAITDMESLYDYQAVLAFLKGESYLKIVMTATIASWMNKTLSRE